MNTYEKKRNFVQLQLFNLVWSIAKEDRKKLNEISEGSVARCREFKNIANIPPILVSNRQIDIT